MLLCLIKLIEEIAHKMLWRDNQLGDLRAKARLEILLMCDELKSKLKRKNMPSRSSHTAVVFENKLYVYSGFDYETVVLVNFNCIDMNGQYLIDLFFLLNDFKFDYSNIILNKEMITKKQPLINEAKLQQLAQSESRRYFRIYKTILEIIDARGYVVSDDHKDMTFLQFNDLFERHQLRDKREVFPPLEMEDNEDYDPSIAVFFNFGNETITEEYIKRAIQSASKIRKFFLVAPTDEKKKSNAVLLDKKAQNFIGQLSKKDKDESEFRIEIFKQEDLLFNVLKHDLVPEHKVLSQAQKNQILIKYKVKQSQLPKILIMDPVAKFLGLRRGQVVKIIRKSETAGTYTTYRIAI